MSALPYSTLDISHAWRPAQTMFRRLLKPQTLDFETAIWEIFNLIVNPKKMYKSQYYKLMGRLRDDPSFLILVTGLLCILAIAWGLAYLSLVWGIVKLIVYMVVIDFYATGLALSTLFWVVVNKMVVLTRVEWGYCFDVHCNAFLVIWGVLYVGQFLLLPLLRLSSVVSVILGNSLYVGAIGYYFVITLYGYNALLAAATATPLANPVRKIQTVIVTGVLPLLGVGWLVAVLTGTNISKTMTNWYFST